MCFNPPEKSRGVTAMKRWWRETTKPLSVTLRVERPSAVRTEAEGRFLADGRNLHAHRWTVALLVRGVTHAIAAAARQLGCAPARRLRWVAREPLIRVCGGASKLQAPRAMSPAEPGCPARVRVKSHSRRTRIAWRHWYNPCCIPNRHSPIQMLPHLA